MQIVTHTWPSARSKAPPAYVQSDGYAVYDGVAMRLNLIHLACMAHARRRFFEAVQALPKSEQKRETAAHDIIRRMDVHDRARD